MLAHSRQEDYAYYDATVAYYPQNAGYLPDFVRVHAAHGPKIRALNAGLYGGHNLAPLHACVRAALTTIAHPANAALSATLGVRPAHGLVFDFNMLLEQYFASVYCYQHGIEVGYVLAAAEQPYFTHRRRQARPRPRASAQGPRSPHLPPGLPAGAGPACRAPPRVHPRERLPRVALTRAPQVRRAAATQNS